VPDPQTLDSLPDQSAAQQGQGPAELSVEPEPAKTRTTRYEIAACEGGTGDGSRRIITPIGVVDASSGPAAIRAYYAQDQTLTASIRLRATPVRNITELDVSVEQVQQVKFS